MGQKSQELCTTVQQRHPAKAASVIQAFVEGGHQHPGASAEQVCVTIAEKCDADEFEKIKPELQSYHVPEYPYTQPLDAKGPSAAASAPAEGAKYQPDAEDEAATHTEL